METEEIHSPQLNIDLGCPLFIQSRFIEERIPTALIGIIPKTGLIIKTPPLINIDEVMPVGNEIVLRYVFLGEIFGFKSKILNSISNPFKLTFITYPENVERLCLRKDRRISCNFPATLHMSELHLKGTVVDISSLGALFSLKRDPDLSLDTLEIDKEIKLHVPMIVHEDDEYIHGKIRNIRHEQGGGVCIGVQFIHVDPDLAAKIESYITDVSGTA